MLSTCSALVVCIVPPYRVPYGGEMFLARSLELVAGLAYTHPAHPRNISTWDQLLPVPEPDSRKRRRERRALGPVSHQSLGSHRNVADRLGRKHIIPTYRHPGAMVRDSAQCRSTMTSLVRVNRARSFPIRTCVRHSLAFSIYTFSPADVLCSPQSDFRLEQQLQLLTSSSAASFRSL